MRIIAGEARGRRLQSPSEGTRPTRDRIKESLFGSIQMRFPCDTALDLFAGSGALGLEALSRGAKRAVLVDHSRDCVRLIRENLATLEWTNRAEVIMMDAIKAIAHLQGRRFDVITLDPPYRMGLGNEAIRAILENNLLAADGIAVLEHAPEEEIIFPACWQRRYGSSVLSAFCCS